MTNPLAQGFYTASEAARLIEYGSLRRITAWLDGYNTTKSGPIIHRNFRERRKYSAQELSFYDLVEARFVSFFMSKGVKARTLRAAAESAREVWDTDRPFALRNIRFSVTADKQIVVQEGGRPFARQDDDPRLWNLVKRQFEMAELLYDQIEHSIVFDDETGLARLWHPRITEFPCITVNPKVAYGKPAVKSGVPTEAIYNAWMAEGKDLGVVRDWYELPIAEAQEAVGFECSLRGESVQAACVG